MNSDANPAGRRRAAAIHDDGSGDVGHRLAEFAIGQRHAGRRIFGLVMEYRDQGPDRKRAMILVDVDRGTEYPVSQALGTGSRTCQLDPRGFADASAVLRDALRCSPDLVVCNRYGALEAGGGGFADELLALMAADIPVLTVVSEPYVAAWNEFSGHAALLPPVPEAWSAWLSAALAQERSNPG